MGKDEGGLKDGENILLQEEQNKVKQLEKELEATKSALENKEFLLKQFARDAVDIREYFILKARIDAMEELACGEEETWDLEEANKEMEDKFPDGPPGDAVMAMYASMDVSPPSTPSN